MTEQPIKPSRNSSLFVGKYGPDLVAFLPKNSSYLKGVERGDAIECANHVLSDDFQIIRPGDKIFAVKRSTGGRKGVGTFAVSFYCNVACQRNHALEIRARERRK